MYIKRIQNETSSAVECVKPDAIIILWYTKILLKHNQILKQAMKYVVFFIFKRWPQNQNSFI